MMNDKRITINDKRFAINGERLLGNDNRPVSLAGCLAALLLLLFLSGCDRRELTYYSTAEIRINADWSRANLDYEKKYGATVVFYPRNGGEPMIVLMGDRTSETVRLQEGTYDAVLFNRSFYDFSNLLFRGHETLETFEAYAARMETRIADQPYGTRSVITGNPEKIAAAVIRDIEVTEDMLGNYDNASLTREASGQLNFIPRELTRTLHVKLDINGVSNIRSVKCVISGVPSSLFLHDGSLGDAGHSQEFTLGDPVLHAGSFTDGYQETTVNVFGFDKNVPHKIRITALLVDGKTVVEQTVTGLEITEREDADGTLQLYIEGQAPETIPDVKPEGSMDSGFGAEVDEWGEEKNEDILL